MWTVLCTAPPPRKNESRMAIRQCVISWTNIVVIIIFARGQTFCIHHRKHNIIQMKATLSSDSPDFVAEDTCRRRSFRWFWQYRPLHCSKTETTSCLMNCESNFPDRTSVWVVPATSMMRVHCVLVIFSNWFALKKHLSAVVFIGIHENFLALPGRFTCWYTVRVHT